MTEPTNGERARRAVRALDTFRTADDPAQLGAGDVLAELLASLRHYADRSGIDFGKVLAASNRAYNEQRGSEGHPYRVGHEVQIRDGVALSPSLTTLPTRGVVAALYPGGLSEQAYAVRFPGEVNAMPFLGSEIEPAPPFPPVQTSRGAVRCLTDAEDALIRAAARIQVHRLGGTRQDRADIRDRRVLAAALGEICGLTPEQMLGQVDLRVTAKVREDLADNSAPAVAAPQLAGRDYPQRPGGLRAVVLGAAEPAATNHPEREARRSSPRAT